MEAPHGTTAGIVYHGEKFCQWGKGLVAGEQDDLGTNRTLLNQNRKRVWAWLEGSVNDERILYR
jgi:hypothetical protein